MLSRILVSVKSWLHLFPVAIETTDHQLSGWNHRNLFFRALLESRSLKSGCGWDPALSGGSRGQSFLVSSHFQWFQELLGFLLHSSNLRPHLHMVTPLSSLLRTWVIGFQFHQCNTGWYHLKIRNFLHPQRHICEMRSRLQLLIHKHILGHLGGSVV